MRHCRQTGRALSASRWRWWLPKRCTRRRTRPNAWRSITSRLPSVDQRALRSRGGRATRSTTTLPMSASTPMLAISPRPRQRSPARRMSCGSRPGSSASPACRWSRARASRPATIRRAGRYTLHAGSGGVVRQKRELRQILRRADRRSARRRARHRRQFRHAQRLLPRIRAGGLGGEAYRPAGEVDLRAPGGVPQRLSGPRPDRRGRAGARLPTGISWRCAARTSAISARTACLTCR